MRIQELPVPTRAHHYLAAGYGTFGPITVRDAAKALPVLNGTGWVRDLQDAATLDPELITLLNQAKAAPTHAEFKNTDRPQERRFRDGC